MFTFRRVLVAGALTVALVTGLVTVAFAHALYTYSVPAANSTVTTAPTQLVAHFAEGVTPSSASLTITGPNGQRVDNGDGHVDLNDPARETMIVTLKPGLGSGVYTVHWATVSSDDGDAANGTFTFTVAQPSTVASAAQPAALPKTGGLPILPVAGTGIALAATGIALRRRGN